MVLLSRRALTESVARQQIVALSDFCSGLMRPDKCSEVDPIRTLFDPSDISKPIEWLAQPFGEFFYQKGRPIYVSGQMWNLDRGPDSHFPAGPFTNYWTGQFDGRWARQVGIVKVEGFVAEMFRVTGSDYAFLTTEADRKAKNTSNAASPSYKGMDLVTGVPGLYWINLFSDEYAGWLGLSELPRRLARLGRLVGGGVSLKFCESPEECRSFDVLQQQRAAIEWLGPERFFDIRFPDRKAITPDWTRMPLPTVDAAG